MTEVYSSLLAAKFSRCAFTRCRILPNISSSQLALSEALYAPVMDCGASLTLPLLCWRAHPPFRETEGKKLPRSIRQLALAISMRSMAESTEKFPADAVAISESSTDRQRLSTIYRLPVVFGCRTDYRLRKWYGQCRFPSLAEAAFPSSYCLFAPMPQKEKHRMSNVLLQAFRVIKKGLSCYFMGLITT